MQISDFPSQSHVIVDNFGGAAANPAPITGSLLNEGDVVTASMAGFSPAILYVFADAYVNYLFEVAYDGATFIPIVGESSTGTVDNAAHFNGAWKVNADGATHLRIRARNSNSSGAPVAVKIQPKSAPLSVARLSDGTPANAAGTLGGATGVIGWLSSIAFYLSNQSLIIQDFVIRHTDASPDTSYAIPGSQRLSYVIANNSTSGPVYMKLTQGGQSAPRMIIKIAAGESKEVSFPNLAPFTNGIQITLSSTPDLTNNSALAPGEFVANIGWSNV